MSKKIKKVNKNYKLALSYLKKGLSTFEVIEVLMDKGFAKSTSATYTSFAVDMLREEYEKDKTTMIGLHLKRYDNIYLDNFDPKLPDNIPVNIRRSVKIDRNAIAMESLMNKEKLLGMHTDNFFIQINNIKKEKEEERNILESKLDFSKLEVEELIELKSLIQKGIEDDSLTIIRRDRENEEDNQEVEYIDYKEVRKSSIKEVEEERVIEEKIEIKEDFIDVGEKLKLSQQKEIIKSMEGTGSKLLDEYKKIIESKL